MDTDPPRTVTQPFPSVGDSPPASVGDLPTVSGEPAAATTVGSAAGPLGFDLHEVVGVGGMGVVYRATDRAFGRDVAVKVLKDGYPATGRAARRFVHEARVTGQLQHPGIPAAYHVGELQGGRPFLAMKLIRGQTLGDLLKAGADRGRLVAAFEGVCQAVAYAHAHGVLHRDLKPANVMVGAFGEVQVMDWGLAKLLKPFSREADSTEPTADEPDAVGNDGVEPTQAGAILGTPAYMPPEQARGEPVDPRSDVFGLGAVLCALLTGQPPFAAGESGSTLAAAAAGDVSAAAARLDGCGADPGLVALCKRCLSVGPGERPADAGAVAEAVAALRAAADDRARRAAVEAERAAVREAEGRKRRRLLAAAAVVLAGAAGVAGWQAVRARSEAAYARRAEQAAVAEGERAKVEEGNARESAELARQREAQEKTARETAEAVQGFMQDVFAQASAEGQANQTRQAKQKLTVEEAMDYAGAEIEKQLAGRPEVEAAVRNTIGNTYCQLGAYSKAEPHLERALAFRRRTLGDAHPHTLGSVNNLARLLSERGDFHGAEPLHREALAGFRKVLGDAHPNTLRSVNNLALLLSQRGDKTAAEPLYREALTGFRKVLGNAHPDTLNGAINLASVLHARGDHAAAEPLLREALDAQRKALGDTHPDTLNSVNNLGAQLHARGDHAAAEPLLREALAGRRKALGDAHPLTLTSVNNLAMLLRDKGDLQAAEPMLQEVLAGHRKAIGDAHPLTIASVTNLAMLLYDLRRFGEAVPLFRDALTGCQKRPETAFTALLTQSYLGLSLLGAAQPAEAEPHLRAGYAGLSQQKALGPKNRNRLRMVTHALADLYAADRPDEAAEWRAKLAALPPEAAPPPRPVR